MTDPARLNPVVFHRDGHPPRLEMVACEDGGYVRWEDFQKFIRPRDRVEPCPFCGSEQIIQVDCRMHCRGCAATGPPTLTTTAPLAVIKKWNRRRPTNPGTASEAEMP